MINMRLEQIKKILENNSEKNVSFEIDGVEVPSHFHLTEVGKVSKVFIDCGGTKRESENCVLQIWIADDKAHRLTNTKMLKILRVAESIFSKEEDPNVQVEYENENGLVSQYPVSSAIEEVEKIIFTLGKIRTACLAPDKCGVGCCSTAQDVLLTLKKVKK